MSRNLSPNKNILIISGIKPPCRSTAVKLLAKARKKAGNFKLFLCVNFSVAHFISTLKITYFWGLIDLLIKDTNLDQVQVGSRQTLCRLRIATGDLHVVQVVPGNGSLRGIVRPGPDVESSSLA